MTTTLVITETTDSAETMAELLRHIASMIDNGYTSGYYPHWTMLEDADDASTWRQTACRHCGLDIEGDTAADPQEWRDRGGETTCNYLTDRDDNGALIKAPAGQLHQPTPDN